MNQEPFYAHFNTAKLQSGHFWLEVNKACKSGNSADKVILRSEVMLLLSQLRKSSAFFQIIGQKTQLDVHIIFYSTLLRRLYSP